MLSRLADSLFWLGRYVERAENVARFIGVNLNLMLDLPMEKSQQWRPLAVTTGDYAAFEKTYGEPTRENVIRFLLMDPSNPNSVLSCMQKARENARTSREVISSEMWEHVNVFYHHVSGALNNPPNNEFLSAFCRSVRFNSHLLTGLSDDTLSHNEAWHFLRLGRLFERADKTARILDVKYFFLLPKVEDIGTPYDVILWTALLKSASASEMYRKKHSLIQPAKVAEFLMLDPDFPRSIRYCLVNAEKSLRAITNTPPGTYSNNAEKQLGLLRAELDYADVGEIIQGGLHEYLDNFEAKLNSVGEALFSVFLAFRPLPVEIHEKEIQERKAFQQ
jgi:uncharacterized alpha-E superfamily protein